MNKIKLQKGFTMMELLVVMAFVGLSVSIVAVLFGSLRFKDRDIQQLYDARRLSDITQLRTGLDLFYSNAGGYPDSHFWVTGQVISCDESKILQVPKDPSKGDTNPYLYKSKGNAVNSKSCRTKVWSDYSIQFATQGKSYLGSAGIYCLTPAKGIVSGKCL